MSFCEVCFGKGGWWADIKGVRVSFGEGLIGNPVLWVPCKNCGSLGNYYCCEGDCSQPEPIPSRKMPRKSKYDWPDQVGKQVLFQMLADETFDDAQRRIVNASRMKYHRRIWGWGIKTQRTDGGILFEWRR